LCLFWTLVKPFSDIPQLALVILCALAVVGLAMAALGRDDPLGSQGALVLLAALAGMFGVISGYFEPEPGEDRLDRYYDDPRRIGILLANGMARCGFAEKKAVTATTDDIADQAARQGLPDRGAGPVTGPVKGC